jgi:hypothetical protein
MRWNVCVVALFGLITACGGPQTVVLPDESADLQVGSGGEQTRVPSHLSGTRPAGPALNGTQWTWVESHCTEGPLDLAARGFASTVRVSADEGGLWLTHDQVFEAESCGQTVVQRASPSSSSSGGEGSGADWQMREDANVAVPPACGATAEPDRPGDIRLRGEFLEVYIQRSAWCNGLEVRMVFAPTRAASLSTSELVRHYAAHFDRGDANSLSALFADTGSLVEPFTISDTGSTRHETRIAVRTWYQGAFADLPWVAFRLTSLSVEGDQASGEWEYMDPRLDEPGLLGTSQFTVAGGEIFETEMRLRSEDDSSDTLDSSGETNE